MHAILLCAGFGTRLHPLTKHTPNALLEVAGKPVLDYQMDQLIELPGLEEIHVVVNSRFAAHFYRWEERWLERLAARGIRLYLHNDGSLDEERRLGEVGDLAFVLRLIDPAKGALVSAGDNVYRFALAPLWEQFQRSDENVVLALPERHHQVLQQHSVITFDDDHLVQQIVDRPESPPAQWVCPTLYFLQPSALGRVNGYLETSEEDDRLACFIDHLAGQEPVRVVPLPEGRLRLHINTRYMYDKARTLLKEEAPVVA